MAKIIKKGAMLEVRHSRKGKFIGIATEDFDPNEETFYPIAVTKGIVHGINTDWEAGENIPCRNSLCTIKVMENSL